MMSEQCPQPYQAYRVGARSFERSIGALLRQVGVLIKRGLANPIDLV
jgi:hypothetical protein